MNSYVDRCDYNPGDTIDGHYRVIKVLGEGSFGKVYRVKDTSGQEYALKMLRLWEVPPDIREPLTQRFKMEFETGKIDCDYLVRATNYGFTGGNPYIVMELCSGGDLASRMGKAGEDMLLVARQVLLGLKALHENGKVHRDLKPENVLFKNNGVAALTDFGIAGDRNKRMTERNIFGKPYQIFGTYAYMPPEQVNRARGVATVLPTTDIWSFGVMMYQMVTGELPFGRLEDHNDLVAYQRRGKNGEWSRSRLYVVPNGQLWEQLMELCLVPDFKKRAQSVQEILSLLPLQSGGHNSAPLYPSSAVPALPKIPTSRGEQQLVGTTLHIMQGEDYGKFFVLDELVNQSQRRILTLGREHSNDLCITETNGFYVSRYHCTLERPQPGVWVLRDGQWDAVNHYWRMSSNGTFVNSQVVPSVGIVLKRGDIITVGDTKLRVESR